MENEKIGFASAFMMFAAGAIASQPKRSYLGDVSNSNDRSTNKKYRSKITRKAKRKAQAASRRRNR